ncbi:efhand_3 domain-containing protein/EF_hand_3 domain-containing protein [Cephalotus follicularis]|uniref:Efhand_3 domain-containing protein/EF_hand_3 domain-containing protein n=1 Tax=Cephalotus follicularis TaxID=3775 RepID=A0A1Q3D6S2_CEPFO|nr:efhand_3 domain-containing protein/EF_hand_3 domain-containing protein [Cephalotus follicularis]
MAGQHPVPNMDQFELYFKRADLDGDGRISGHEAVTFFKASNLPQQVLAQIWMIADQARIGSLGRQEFFNALKLVTVAQSKRDLTPDIVKAALYGPAAAKIPAPQINLTATPTSQISSTAAASSPQMGAVAPITSQNHGFGGPGVPNATMNQNYFPSHQSPSMRPPQGIPAGTAPRPHQGTGPSFSVGGSMVGQTQAVPAGIASRPPQAVPAAPAGLGVTGSNISSDWLSGRTSAAPTGVSQSTPSATPKPQTMVSPSSQPITSDARTSVVSGNGFATDSNFGGDVFSVTSATPKRESSGKTYSASSAPSLSAIVPVSGGAQPAVKPNSLDSLQTAFSIQPAGSQLQQTQSSLKSGQQVSAQSGSSIASSGISAGVVNSTSNSSQLSWPKMKPSDVQKYTKVFTEVDTDRDGKITGEQARNLFLSWRLPREVLKQVWDLSDQDSDSMLSLREFCFALYLMERFREGRPLPAALPSNIMLDETLLSMTGQPDVNYGNAAWGPSPGFGQPQGMGARSMPPTAGLRPPVPVTALRAEGVTTFSQQKLRAPVMDGAFANQHDNGEQNFMNSKLQDATAEGEKVEQKENVIMDSREKIEFYRTKMQELVLYKSRCDNRLNEITERAIADKREAESLRKKYEEKYKQVAEVASKLTIEEAKFRETQERKKELHQAIIRMEQGGSADGILQVRADRIQSDLEELLRVLTERCKKHGIDVKSSSLIEIPIGWQPGIQEGAAVWNEDWDKFEDEGFGNDTVDVSNVSVSPNPNSTIVQGEKSSPDGSLTPDSLFNVDENPGSYMSPREHILESESAFTHSEDELARSPHGSSASRTALESPSHSDLRFGKNTEADAETHGSFDESTWGAFDNNDDIDSVWGFNPANTKDSDFDKHGDFFGTSDFGVNPIRTGSPSAESVIFQKKSAFAFDDSVPSTPMSKYGNSPPRYGEASGDHFDSFSRFDSFSMHDSGFSQQPDRLTRFDSINSTKDFGRYSFDDSDPFGSSGPFKVSSENKTPKRGSDNWNAF